MKRREVTNFQDHVKRVTNFLRSRNTLSGKGEIPLSVKLRYDDECLRFSLRARPASWDARKSNEVKSLFTEDGPLEVTTGSHEVKPLPSLLSSGKLPLMFRLLSKVWSSWCGNKVMRMNRAVRRTQNNRQTLQGVRRFAGGVRVDRQLGSILLYFVDHSGSQPSLEIK